MERSYLGVLCDNKHNPSRNWIPVEELQHPSLDLPVHDAGRNRGKSYPSTLLSINSSTAPLHSDVGDTRPAVIETATEKGREFRMRLL